MWDLPGKPLGSWAVDQDIYQRAWPRKGFDSNGVDIHDTKFERKLSHTFRLHIWDLLDDTNINNFCIQISQRRILFIHIGLDCSSFSVLRIRSRTTSRSKSNPWGNETFAGEAAGNKLVLNMLRIIACCDAMGVFWLVEKSVFIQAWGPPPFQKIAKKKNTAVFDQCCFGSCDTEVLQ